MGCDRAWRSWSSLRRSRLWIAPSRQTSSAQDAAKPAAPALISRGYTDAPAGTAVCRRSRGWQRLLELRVKDGQKVKRDEVIAVLSNYPKADVRCARPRPTSRKPSRHTTRC